MIQEPIHNDIADKDIYISKIQAEEIRRKIDTIVTLKHSRSWKRDKVIAQFYSEVMNKFLEQFEIFSIGELQDYNLKTAHNWLDRHYQSIPQKKLKKERIKTVIDPEVIELSKIIQSKAQRELKMNISKVLYFAYQNLKLPSMISKLEKLPKEQLEDLYRILFQMSNDK